MRIQRSWAMPTADTFDCEPIHNFVRKYLSASRISIDPFARNKQWATYTNDLNPHTSAKHHMDAEEFVRMLADQGVIADLVVIDPPYSPRQLKECYDSIGIAMTQADGWTGWLRAKLREEIDRVLGPDGVVLWFGWNTTGMGQKYGFGIEEILLVCHGSDHNDTICLAEKRLQGGLFEKSAGRVKVSELGTESL